MLLCRRGGGGGGVSIVEWTQNIKSVSICQE